MERVPSACVVRSHRNEGINLLQEIGSHRLTVNLHSGIPVEDVLLGRLLLMLLLRRLCCLNHLLAVVKTESWVLGRRLLDWRWCANVIIIWELAAHIKSSSR